MKKALIRKSALLRVTSTLLVVLFFVVLFVTSACSNSATDKNNSKTVEKEEQYYEIDDTNYVNIKYFDIPVDISDSRFEYLNTTKSSFINGVWYDEDEEYMVAKLNDIYYHYSGISVSVWRNFKNADSFGTFYNEAIKGNYAYN